MRLQPVYLYICQWVLHPKGPLPTSSPPAPVPLGCVSRGSHPCGNWGSHCCDPHTVNFQFQAYLKKNMGERKERIIKFYPSILLSISRPCSPSKSKTSSPLSKVQFCKFCISYWDPSRSLCLCGQSQLHGWLSCVTAQDLRFRKAPPTWFNVLWSPSWNPEFSLNERPNIFILHWAPQIR